MPNLLRSLACLSLAGMPFLGLAQPDSTAPERPKGGDTLAFRVLQVAVDTVRNKVTRTAVAPVLVYDFRSQYPWYRTQKAAWRMTDRYQLEFRKLPPSGWLYLYSVDGANDVRYHGSLRLGGLKPVPLLFPDSLKTFAFSAAGADQLVVWYSPDSVAQAERLIRGIELTIGDFVKRNNRQIHGTLVLPAYGWQMEAQDYGFTTAPDFYSIPARFILPVIVRFDVASRKRPSQWVWRAGK